LSHERRPKEVVARETTFGRRPRDELSNESLRQSANTIDELSIPSTIKVIVRETGSVYLKKNEIKINKISNAYKVELPKEFYNY